jgi:polyhydroxybutyrate depolymerase
MNNRGKAVVGTLWLVALATPLGCSRTTLDAMVAATPPDAPIVAPPDARVVDAPRADTQVVDAQLPDTRVVDAPPACPTPALAPGDTTMILQVNGVERNYLLHIPNTYTGQTRVPLVLDFHALTGSGPWQRATSPWVDRLDAEGVVMAFPSGLAGPSGTGWNAGGCCVANVDDVAFSRRVVDHVQSSACIDPKRIYAVGFSMGGGMDYYLACRAADLFAGIAPFSFDLFKESLPTCTPPRPITVISFRGTDDKLIPYAGGPSAVVQGMPVTFLGAQGTFQKWAEINQCAGTASSEDSDGCSSYAGCKDGVETILCTKQGGGQDPGNAAMTALAWSVLKRHSLP